MNLFVFGTGEPPETFLEDAEMVRELNPAKLEGGLKVITENPKELLFGDSEELQFDQQLQQHVQPENVDAFKGFTNAVINGSAKYDCNETELEADFEELGFDEDQRDLLVEAIIENQEFFRRVFTEISTRTATPRLRDVRWKLTVDQDTARIRGANRKTVLLTLVLGEQDSTEEVTVEFPEDEFDRLARLSSQLDDILETLSP